MLVRRSLFRQHSSRTRDGGYTRTGYAAQCSPRRGRSSVQYFDGGGPFSQRPWHPAGCALQEEAKADEAAGRLRENAHPRARLLLQRHHDQQRLRLRASHRSLQPRPQLHRGLGRLPPRRGGRAVGARPWRQRRALQVPQVRRQHPPLHGALDLGAPVQSGVLYESPALRVGRVRAQVSRGGAWVPSLRHLRARPTHHPSFSHQRGGKSGGGGGGVPGVGKRDGGGRGKGKQTVRNWNHR
mmetsp:Transcript_11670/g.23566  ORF Transcript_11670/g.23566 Transcript_11670/m.23566 type:complete len:240 (-) Transcript_11670:274-993(-)